MKLYASILKSFLMKAALDGQLNLSSDEKALACTSGMAVIQEQGGSASEETVCAELARHPELKRLAVYIREKKLYAAWILASVEAIARHGGEQTAERLKLIEKLVSWSPSSKQNLEDLAAETEVFLR